MNTSKLYTDMIWMIKKNDRLEEEDKLKNQNLEQLKLKINDCEKERIELQHLEQSAIKTINNLTALRETMARKASAALAEVRETKEELKIKELLILDLTKR